MTITTLYIPSSIIKILIIILLSLLKFKTDFGNIRKLKIYVEKYISFYCLLQNPNRILIELTFVNLFTYEHLSYTIIFNVSFQM